MFQEVEDLSRQLAALISAHAELPVAEVSKRENELMRDNLLKQSDELVAARRTGLRAAFCDAQTALKLEIKIKTFGQDIYNRRLAVRLPSP